MVKKQEELVNFIIMLGRCDIVECTYFPRITDTFKLEMNFMERCGIVDKSKDLLELSATR